MIQLSPTRSFGLRPTWFTATALAVACFASPAFSAGEFIVDKPARDIYHDGWIDLDKNGKKDPYEDTSLDIETRITDLLGRMTLEEKTAQMVTLYGFSRVVKDELPTEAWKTSMWKDGIGNIDEHANGNEESAKLLKPKYAWPLANHTRLMNDVQRFFIEETRLGVPADFTNEGVRGLLHTKATSFPAQIAVGSTWDKDLVLEIGRTTGSEARALGYTNVYSPTLDLSRDPRWGRTPDTYSEDPYLTGELGMAEVRGIQSQHVVSTVKHFAVYSIPKGGRDGESRTDPQATWRDVQTIFLYPFRKAFRDAGALGVMASYNDYDGIPMEGNPLFLTDILRHEWGFKGYVVSDSKAVEFIHTKHHVAIDYPEAIRQAVQAGLNIRTDFTQPDVYVNPLRQLVHDGKLSQETIDSRVRDILRVKYWLGLFDQPYARDPEAVEHIVRSPEHMEAAWKAARESIVLLKNEGGLLPLKKTLHTVLVTGPLADAPKAWYNRYGPQALDYVTVLAGIKKKLGVSCEVRYAPGVALIDENYPESDVEKEPPSAKVREGIDAAVAAAKGADAVIVAVGEDNDLCSESHSRISLNLPGYQEELVRALQATGVPVVMVMSNGRPLSVNWPVKHIPAILEAWFPGEQGGDAIADILFGDYNPSGRLPITFPHSVGQIPMNFPAHPGSQGADKGQIGGVLFPFGFGLSYTTFSYANLKITPPQQGPQGNIEVSCDVTNSGDRAGEDVVELYLRDDYSSVVTFEKTLQGFTRVHLEPGKTATVHFTLTPENLQLYDRNNHWTVEPGRFTVMIGTSSETTKLEGSFMITDGSTPKESSAPKTEHADPL